MNFMPADTQPPCKYEYICESRPSVSTIKHQAFFLMDQLDGWCSHQKASILIDLILKTRPQKIVEIGVWGGKSLIPMAYALKINQQGMIYGIDPWSNEASMEGVVNEDNKAFWGWVDHSMILRRLIKNIWDFQLENQITLIQDTSLQALPIEEIDLLHIDGNHSTDTSYFDVIKWVKYVRPGGHIVFDDMTWHENGVFTTAKAVEWLDQHCIRLAVFSDNCEWGIWIKS